MHGIDSTEVLLYLGLGILSGAAIFGALTYGAYQLYKKFKGIK